jgi:hypothetical protein
VRCIHTFTANSSSVQKSPECPRLLPRSEHAVFGHLVPKLHSPRERCVPLLPVSPPVCTSTAWSTTRLQRQIRKAMVALLLRVRCLHSPESISWPQLPLTTASSLARRDECVANVATLESFARETPSWLPRGLRTAPILVFMPSVAIACCNHPCCLRSLSV